MSSSRIIQTAPGGPCHRRKAFQRLPLFALVTLGLVASPLAIAATFIVEEATDAALRAAVTLANQTAGQDIIVFAPGITSITLTEGQIEITESLTITGAPGQVVTLSGNNASRVFAVIDPGETFPTLRLEHLVIENGRTTALGSAFVDAPFVNCSSNTGQGGAVCSEGSVELFETIVRNNVTVGRAADGGGIWAAGDVVLQFSSVLGNTIGGQAIDGDDASGGGIASAFGEVVCSDSRISDNQSIDIDSQGGGVLSIGFFANNCIVSGNQAGSGGGIFASQIDIASSTIAGNTAGFNGGGILASASFISSLGESFGALQIVNSTISGNQALDGRGGGIRWIAPDNTDDVDGDESPDARIANSTITANSAAFGAGGVDIIDPFFVSQGSSPAFSLSRTRTLEERSDSASRLRMIENRAPERGATRLPLRPEADGVFAPEIISTILSANVTGGESDPDLVIITEGQRPVVLLDENNFIGFGDLLDIEALRDNGCFEGAGALTDGQVGCVQTHRPFSFSSVIDNGLNPLLLSFDQRGGGFAREIGLAADIGAHETEQLAITNLGVELEALRRGEPIDLFWSAVPNVPAVECTGGGLTGTGWEVGVKPAEGFEQVDSTSLAPGFYSVGLVCELDGEAQSTFTGVEILEPIEVELTLEPLSVSVGGIANLGWSAQPDDSATLCSAQSEPLISQWAGPVATSGTLDVDTGLLFPGTFLLALICERGEFSASAEVELTVTDAELALSLQVSAEQLIIGDILEIDWTVLPDDEFSACEGLGLEGTEWNGPQANSGSLAIDTTSLGEGEYTIELACSRFNQQVSEFATFTVDLLTLNLDVTPTSLVRGDLLTINWIGTEGLACTGSGLPGTTWPGVDKPGSGTQTVSTAPLPAGDYTIGLLCDREGLTVEAEATVTVLDLELVLTVVPTSQVRGDDLSISWTGTAGLVCTGSGLPGTTWPGTGKPASGSETVSTAPLAAGDYAVGLLCERAGVSIEAAGSITILPLELTLQLTPTTLVRGDELTVSWAGTEGLICTSSGLPGTSWPGSDKPASGTETIDTENLERGEYPVGLVCQRRGVEVSATASVTVLARPAELSLAANLINMAIEGSQFVEFALSNSSENPAFELQLRFDPPTGYEVAAVFRQAAECAVTPGETSEVRCDVGAIPDWTCEIGPEGGACQLLTLPPGGIAGVVIQYQGAGEATVVGNASAVNAADRSAELSIGN